MGLTERGFTRRRSGGAHWWFGIGLVTHVTDRDPDFHISQISAPHERESEKSGHAESQGSQDGDGVALINPFAADPPTVPCPSCGQRAWWHQAGRAWVCGVCHPPPRSASEEE